MTDFFFFFSSLCVVWVVLARGKEAFERLEGLPLGAWLFTEERDGELGGRGSGKGDPRTEEDVGHLSGLPPFPFFLPIAHHKAKRRGQAWLF